MKSFAFSLGYCGLIAGIALASAPTPLLAQEPEEIVVVGRYGTAPDHVQSLSQSVGYGDLDLSTEAGRDMLRQRLRLTARFLCNKLGESDVGTPGPAPSCRTAAVQDAMARVGTIEQHFAPRGTTWVAPAAWQPPYPPDWVTLYPD